MSLKSAVKTPHRKDIQETLINFCRLVSIEWDMTFEKQRKLNEDQDSPEILFNTLVFF